MSQHEIQTLISELCREIESLWKISDYEYYGFNNEEIGVTTLKTSSSTILPNSNLPIRGIGGVEVIPNKSRKNQRDIICDFIDKSLGEGIGLGWRSKHQNKKEYDVINGRIQDCKKRLFLKLEDIPNLSVRIYDSFVHKHYDSWELAEKIENKDEQFIGILEFSKDLFFSKILANELHRVGFNPQNKLSFERWDEIAVLLTEKIYLIAEKPHNEYEIVIFLNTPIIDEKAPITLLNTKGDSLFSIESVNDELLSKLYKITRNNQQLQWINTAIKCQLILSVNDTVEKYLEAYYLAAKIAESVVDCIRLVRDEDIGVIALEIFPTDDLTPHIEKTYEEDYQPSLAIFIPKRFYFKTEITQPLSSKDLNLIGRLLCGEFKDVKGLDTAIRRFRSSCERYLPDDPERLLDMAFAFEAIFLNDGDNKELSYRLALRAAKLLGRTLEERQEIFEVIKKLYDFRSKIAHGETLDTMKPKDANKLKQVLSRAPRILKNAIIEMILGNAPRGLTKTEEIGNWWRNLELGMDDITQVSNSKRETE